MIHNTIQVFPQNMQMKCEKNFILWSSGLQLFGVALRDTVHLYHVTSYFLLYPLLYGVARSDSVTMHPPCIDYFSLMFMGFFL